MCALNCDTKHHTEDCHHHDGCCCGDLTVETAENHEDEGSLLPVAVRLVVSVSIFISALIFNPENPLKILLFGAAYIIIAYDIVLEAFKNLVQGRFMDENFLMTVATLGAFAIGEYPESIMVMVLYRIGEAFCSIAVAKSKGSIKHLMALKPDIARVLRNGEMLNVKPSELKIGETIVILPGDKIPADALVVEGSGFLNTSNLTGEPLPKEINPGEEILSGYINLENTLKAVVTKLSENSAAAKVIAMLKTASSKKAKTESFIRKFAKIYTPLVILLAVILFTVPSLLSHDPLLWFERALTFLVISCPCALVISVPLSFFAGLGTASKHGILVKGSCYLEALARVSTVVFDKTGTLTQGKLRVSGVFPALDEAKNPVISEKELLKTAAYAEFYSSHPIAKSLITAYGGTIDASQIKNAKEIPGKGMRVELNGEDVVAGSISAMQMFNIPCTEAVSGGTIIYIARSGRLLGYIEISDTIKENAKEAILSLKQDYGTAKTVMLTGDREAPALKTAAILGIDEVYHSLLPDMKAQRMTRLLEEKPPKTALLYVGDGINDAPVLALADVGVAMGKLGSDAAIEACDVVLTDDNLFKIGEAVKIARKTLHIARQNIFYVLLVKFLFLALGAAGLVGIQGAVFADVGVTILAVLNAFRVFRA